MTILIDNKYKLRNGIIVKCIGMAIFKVIKLPSQYIEAKKLGSWKVGETHCLLTCGSGGSHGPSYDIISEGENSCEDFNPIEVFYD